MLESIVSGHKVNLIRPRLDEKLEVIRFDPWSKFCNSNYIGLHFNNLDNFVFS